MKQRKTIFVSLRSDEMFEDFWKIDSYIRYEEKTRKKLSLERHWLAELDFFPSNFNWLQKLVLNSKRRNEFWFCFQLLFFCIWKTREYLAIFKFLRIFETLQINFWSNDLSLLDSRKQTVNEKSTKTIGLKFKEKEFGDV